jgi:hypothetical protein
VVRVTGVSAELSGLAAEFPGYEFGTQRTWDGISIVALCHDGAARPGLYVVVTHDLDEMRRALLEGPLTPCNTPGGPCVLPLASGRNVA